MFLQKDNVSNVHYCHVLHVSTCLRDVIRYSLQQGNVSLLPGSQLAGCWDRGWIKNRFWPHIATSEDCETGFGLTHIQVKRAAEPSLVHHRPEEGEGCQGNYQPGDVPPAWVACILVQGGKKCFTMFHSEAPWTMFLNVHQNKFFFSFLKKTFFLIKRSCELSPNIYSPHNFFSFKPNFFRKNKSNNFD